MDFSKMSTIEKTVEVVSAIEHGAGFGGEIWQTDFSGRNIYPVLKIQTDTLSNKIILQTDGISGVSSLYPIYVRLKYRNILFRLDPHQFSHEGDQLICQFPQDVLAVAARTTERYVMPFANDISLSLKRTARTLKEINFDIEVRIIDVSEQGFGIQISGMNKDYLKPYDHFWIRAIDHRALHHELFGTVLYVAPKGFYHKRHDVRVGLSLSNRLNYETFEYLKTKSHLVLGA